MAVTRIKNNQITDSTITAAKIASGTLTGGLFASDLTLNSNVTINGNLTLTGNTDSISATNTYVNDPLVVFNNGFVGAPSYDIGILVNRNLTSTAPYGSVNAAWVWREADDAFEGLMTTETGATTGSINNSGFANLKVGNITANSLSLTTGTLTASSGITGTPISGSTGHFTVLQGTAFSTGNAVISGGYISALTNATITTATLTNLAATTAVATNLSTANAVITGGYVNGLANLTATTAQATNFSSGNIQATGTTAGTWSTANVALYEQLTNSTTNASFYVPFYDKATGNAAAYTNTALNFNPSTGALTATQLYGTIMGTTSTANVALYENLTNSTTNATFYPAFYDKATGNAAAYTNTSVNVNPSTGTVSATQFVGGGAGLTDLQAAQVRGTVATANVSLYDSITATTTNATFYPQVVDKTSGNAASYSVSSFTINPSTGALSATSFNGNHYGTTAQFTNFSSGNVVISGGYISSLTNATITTATTTTLNAGTATAATLNATAGNVTTLYAGSVNTANAVISGGYISALTNAYITTGYITNFSTANAQITGGSISGITNLGATTFYAQNFSSGNAVITGGYINSLANLTATTAQFTNLSSGNIVATGTTTGTWSTANVALYEQLTNTTTNATHYVNFYDKATGNAAALTNTALTFNPSTGTLSATSFSGAGAFTTLQATNFSSGNVVISGGYISSLANITATTGSFGTATAATLNATAGNVTTLAATNLSSGNAVITGGSATGLTNFSATTVQATNFSSGNIRVSGGYISALTNATITTASVTNLAATTATATNLASGNVAITGGYVNSLANLTATTAQATNFSTGNARITGGYADNFPIGANTAATGAFTTLTASGSTTLTSTTQSTSTTTGALVVSGGVGIAKDVYIGGNLYVANLIATTSSELVVQDPLLYLTANAYYPYNYDIGIFSHFIGGSANNYQHSGMVRSSSNTYWGFFSNVITEPAATINWADSSLIWDPIKAGELELANTRASTSTTTGALKVAGGAGIAGNLNAGNVTTSMTTGTVMGNVGNFNNLYGTFYGTIAGGAGSANVSLYQSLTDASVNSSHYIAMYDKATGNAAAYTDAGLTYNPSTAVLTATTVSATNGAITTLGATNFSSGNIQATGTTSGTWSTANVSLYESVTATTTNATFYPFLADKTAGNTGSFTASTLTFNPSTGVLSATTFSGTGAFTTLQATNFSSGNVAITGGYINNLANVTASSGTVATLNATAGNVTTLYGQNFSTANAAITGGSITGLTNFTATTGQVTNFSTGNAVISGGYATLSNVYATTAQATNFSTGNALITGGSATGLTSFSATTAQATNFSSGNVVISGGYISALTNATVTTGTFTTLNAATATAATLNATAGNVTTLSAQNFSTGNAVITGGSISGLTNLAATTLAVTNFSTGNAVISGGYISALTNATITTATTTTLNAGTATAATLNATAGNITTLAAGSINTANAVISGGYISALTNATITTGSITNLTSTTAVATNFSSGNIQATGTTSGTWSTANVSLYEQLTNSTTNATFYPSFYDKATGNAAAYTNTALGFNPSTGTLSATVFSGSGASLTNLPATAVVGTVTTANVSLYESVTASTTNATFYPFLADKTSGNTGSFTAAYITVNPSTNTLSANAFVGGTVSATTIDASSTVKATGNIVAGSSTESTSTTTGALVVVGGTGIAGNVTAGKAATFNSGKTAGMDFVVKGKTDETLIWARPGASYDQVVIGNSATTSTLVTGAKLIVNTTDSILLPTGTTAQRPGSVGGTDTTGMFRYNSTINAVEWYTGSTWQTASSQFTTITDTQFNGDGGTVTFTSVNFAAATTNSLIVSINGVIQIPSIAYSLSGSTITFTEAPATGDVIDVRVVTTTATISSLVSDNGFMGFDVKNDGVYILTGTSSATSFNYYNTAGAFVSNIANVSVASANTATTIDTMTNSAYRSAKYTVQVTNGASYQVAEALVIQNGTTATITTYGIVQTAGNLGVLAATVRGGNTLLQFIATNATNNVRVKKEYIAI